MEYTEEVKKEAEEVAKKYMPLAYSQSPVNPNLSSYRVNVEHSYKCAIQDRQSVLDKVNELEKLTAPRSIIEHAFKGQINFLTQQIEYLKSKL